jgi:transposase-like protein
MGNFPGKADGRRIFSAEFKRDLVQRILKSEKTLAQLSREFDISPTIIRDWKRRYESAAAIGANAGEDVKTREAQCGGSDRTRTRQPHSQSNLNQGEAQCTR